MKNLHAALLCDFYKISHREQYPENTEIVYSTWTPRSAKYLPDTDEVVAFGFQGFIKGFLIDFFNDNFFSQPKEEIVANYSRIIRNTLGVVNPDTSHIEDLHDLGYLPLKIKALKEGTLVPLRVPMLTVQNTDTRFFWLTNYIETLASCELWQSATSATIARKYRKILDKYAIETTGTTAGVEFQGHDFSMRGMGGLQAAAKSGAGHLLSFVGTDTIPAVMYLEEHYNANVENELVGCSVPASEHSVMCAGGKESEFKTYERLIKDIYPTGIVSIVSDTWDLWKVLSEIIEPLKDDILARDGGPESLDKVVIRPDSGDPVKIICGDPDAPLESLASKGVVEVLWDIFGGTTTDSGYKILDSHIGCIYGDAITTERCEEICRQLKLKGFASTNMVYGIGSYTYQYNTRDTLGFAMKSTLCVVNGDEKKIFKDPITDDGTKKSATGAVAVFADDSGKLFYKDELFLSEAEDGLLELVFEDGVLLRDQSLAEIREILNGNS